MSKSPLLWKFGLIAVVVLAAFFFSTPPSERINLGLDLRGGAHILMQVETDSALKYQFDLIQTAISRKFNDDGLRFDSIAPAGKHGLELRGTDPSRRAEVRAALEKLLGDWETSEPEPGTWRFVMPATVRDSYEKSAIDMTLTILRNRIDALGVAEPLIQKQGIDGDRILVQLPGVEDPERIKDIMKDPALLEWKEVTYPPGVTDFGNWVPPDNEGALVAAFGGAIPDDTLIYPQKSTTLDGTILTVYWPLKRVSTVSGGDLRNAFRSADEWNEPSVAFELTQDAGRRFEAATTKNVGRKMAIVLGGVDSKEVVSAPVIRSVIRDQGRIEGGFSITEAEDLALKLRSGAIPTEVSIIEERTVGPSLGRDSIRKGLTAGVVGFVGVLLFMVAYYRLAGVNAVVALALNILLVFGTLGALPFLFSGVTDLRATLTLPGIAGLILTVGMAVDANVLIFERIREELKLGKTIRSAVDQGFQKALWTIIDCNVTTIVAASFLALYGTGPVRGFAVTLFIGLLASMFTAVFVSRQLFEVVLSVRQDAETLSI